MRKSPGRWLAAAVFFIPFAATADDKKPSPTPVAPITIENFDGGKLTWSFRNPISKDHPQYVIADENGNYLLRGEPLPTQEGNPIYKPFDIYLKKTPILKWRWKVVTFPKGGDEGGKGKNDSALGVYVYFQSGPLRRLIKYVWSASHAKGDWLMSPGSSWMWKTKIHVLRSGPPTGKWEAESVDLRSDYIAAYGGDAPVKAYGIGVLTDGDQTKSESIGEYDDFETHPPLN